MQAGIVYRREGSCPLQYAVIRKVLEYVHDDVRFTITRNGLDDSTQSMRRERLLSIHAILNARLMEYFKDVLLGQSFRERLWVMVKSNIAYEDIVPWLRANRCPHVYDAETVKAANEYGIYRKANGDVYEGGWKEGKSHGQGKCTWANGDVYEGGCKEGKRHGQGKLTYAYGDVFEGSWDGPQRPNQGKLTWPDGRVYDGDWKGTSRHGSGKQTWPDGRVYIGDWEDDKIHGYGKYQYPDGRVLEGDFINNHLLSRVEL